MLLCTAFENERIRFFIDYITFQLFHFLYLGTIVTVGDPKKKYAKFEKIGQG